MPSTVQALEQPLPRASETSTRELRLPPIFAEPAVYDVAVLSDIGNERGNNEDFVGYSFEAPSSLVMAVADGVGGVEGGELASQIAVESTLSTFRDQSSSVPTEKRLYRAAQQGNIEIYDKAIVVTELRSMATTLTAIALEGGLLHAAHVGDSRLYLIHEHKLTQITKDHTVAADRVRKKLLSAAKARNHPDHGVLTRSLGRELIAAVDRITLPVYAGDTLILCTDGLHNTLSEEDLVEICKGSSAQVMCQHLIDEANSRGTGDNLTVAVCRVVGPLPAQEEATHWVDRLRAWLRN
jgi:PPM family protein phosphatase